jgi:hypothetical protein
MGRTGENSEGLTARVWCCANGGEVEMAIYTPRGLKIRISVPYAFALMARLRPNVTAFRVLKTAEGIEYISVLFGITTAIAAFVLRLQPWQIVVAVAGANIAGWLLRRVETHFIPGVVPIATVFSYVAGYGLVLVPTLLIGIWCVGWIGALSYFVGRMAGGALSIVMMFLFKTPYDKVLGRALTTSEQSFFSAYRFHAFRIGASADVRLSNEELNEDH